MPVNRRISLLALTLVATVLAAALIGALIFGGGAKQTVASRSAAAFREAQRKGEPPGEGAHSHGGLAPGSETQPAQAGQSPSEMTRTERGEQGDRGMVGHDMSGHGISRPGPSADAHAAHSMTRQGEPTGSEGGKGRQKPAEGHVGMHHGVVAAGTPGDRISDASMVPPPPPKAAEASPGQPAGTLRPDPLDRPAETSVLDARRSAQMAAEMGGGHGMQHGTTSYRQLDAGRDSATTAKEEGSVAPRSPASPDHGGMQHGSPPAAAPKAPAMRKPPPVKPTPGAPPPEPTHPPHHSGSDESPRHGEAMR